MQIKELTDYLDSRFLPSYQEGWDNSGFLLGDKEDELRGVLVTLDVTPEVVEEAIEKKTNLIVSHHPLIYSGMKRITTTSEAGRMVMLLTRNAISVYAAHTDLDNLDWGVSGALAAKLGLVNCRVLRPVMGVLRKLVTFVPPAHAEKVRQALFDASGGSHPFCSETGQRQQGPEMRVEVIYEQRVEQQLVAALRKAHPSEEPPCDIIPLGNTFPKVGAGMVGSLPHPMPAGQFFQMLKERLNIPVIRHSKIVFHNTDSTIQDIALCGGSGSFLIGDAKSAGVDIFLTGDLKYHDFQAAEGDIILADIGHYESEQFAKDVIYNVISEKITTFACQISERDKGYVHYI